MFENLEKRLLMDASYTYPGGYVVTSISATNSFIIDGLAGNDSFYCERSTTYADSVIMYSGYKSPQNKGLLLTNFKYFGDAGKVNFIVRGHGGNDTLTIGGDVYGCPFTFEGGAGNDTRVGGTNPDTFIGGPGIDTMSYIGRSEELQLFPDGQANDGAAGEGDNIGGDVENLVGGSNDDILYATNAANWLSGGGGNDSIWGLGGNDTIDGGAGDDQIDGGLGGDKIEGGLGIRDVVTYSYRTASLWLSLDMVANDGQAGEGDNLGDSLERIIGGSGNDTIKLGGAGHQQQPALACARNGNDTIYGSAYADVLDGEKGDDVLYASYGDDQYIGGDGTDRVDFSTGFPNVKVTLDGLTNDGPVSSGEKDNVWEDVENVTGTSGNDNFYANAQNVANVFKGLGGNDTLGGGGGNDILEGGEGNDSISGNEGHDIVRGNAGNDTLNGMAGNDSLTGGIGADVYHGGTGIDTATFATNKDLVIDLDNVADDGEANEHDNVLADMEVLIGGGGNDIIHGSPFYNEIKGGGGNDQLFGEGGMDILEGGPGADLLDGGAGVDTADYSSRSENLTIGIGFSADDGAVNEGDNVTTTIERVKTGSGNDRIETNPAVVADNEFWGGAGNDTLVGRDGGDTLHGDAGNDSLEGGAGLDILDGGKGVDDLDGGDGTDYAWYGNRTAAVIVTLDNARNDGEVGENDLVKSSVEGITGGSGNDSLTGNAGPNAIYGQGGNDTIVGGLGIDTLNGGNGNDLLDSRDGVIDQVFGGAGTDRARADALETLSAVETLLA